MARYYFDSRDNDAFIQDEEGLEFATLEEVIWEASRALAEIAFDVVPGSKRRVLTIEVRDEHGPIMETKLLFEVRLLRT